MKSESLRGKWMRRRVRVREDGRRRRWMRKAAVVPERMAETTIIVTMDQNESW